MVHAASFVGRQFDGASRLDQPDGVISVLLADDHVLFRQALRHLLEDEPDFQIVAEAGDGQSALRQVAQSHPDIILMDISMPGADGVETTRQLKRQHPNVRIIILTMSNEDGHIVQAIRAGADAYLLKTAEAKIVIEAIRSVSRGESIIDPQLATNLLSQFRRMAGFKQDQSSNGLSSRETDMLRLVARGFSNKEIAHELCLAESTVKNRLSMLFEKLDVKDRTQAAIYAVTNGLIDRPA